MSIRVSRSLAHLGVCVVMVVGVFISWRTLHSQTASYSEQEGGPVKEESVGSEIESLFVDPYDTWVRPDGPWRVGLQVGHWRAAEAPDELENLRVNTGASAAGTTEWETNLIIAKRMKALLEAQGVIVDLLPVTVPSQYVADAFLSLHADGNLDTTVAGFKMAAPRRDRSGKAEELRSLLEAAYAPATNLSRDENITRNMRGYYAFNWRRYEHAIHPMTPAVIVETGFLTNARDRRVIVGQPNVVAQALTEGVIDFLEKTVPLANQSPSSSMSNVVIAPSSTMP